MPSVAWNLARAASRAAASSRAAAAAAAATSRDSPVATAAASRGSAVAAAHSLGGVNHPSSRHLVRDPSSPAPPSDRPSEFNEEEAYLPIQEANRFFSTKRRGPGGPLFNLDMRSDKEGMPFDVKDLESEQTLWALYNRWLSYFNVARSIVDKGYRFNIFKERVHLIYELKGADPKNLELNHLSDVTVDELCPPKFFRRRY